MIMERRPFLRAALSGLLGAALPISRANAQSNPDKAEPFSYETVVDRARVAAKRQFKSPRRELTEPFADLTYDQFRGIRFRDDRRIFADAGQAFQMDLLPPGFYFQDAVEVNLVRGETAEPLVFSPDFFEFHPNYFPYPDGKAPSDLAEGLGFSGLRFRHPINRPGVWDEILVFQGASYFRAIARDTFYGLSARGLAIGTGTPEPEEFPIFTAFWVEEPAPEAESLRLAALLDSDSVAGAFEFTVTPGDETETRIRSTLFPRKLIEQVGVAPLTSMYFFGPERRSEVDDFRDAVHDSHALAMVNGNGERLWRPLANPPIVQTSAFMDENPRAFGLIQRFRDFEHFQDAEAHYERRPSAWVAPEGDWGRGGVMLIEIPTENEFSDNVVTFWRPQRPLEPGQEYRFDYSLYWAETLPEDEPVARITGTRGGRSILDANERLFVIDFDLGDIAIADVTPRLGSSGGEVKGLSVSPLPGGNFARVGFHFIPGDLRQIEFRLSLWDAKGSVSEIWLYRWTAIA